MLAPLAQDAKTALLGDIYRQLNPGAPLLLADLMAPTDPLERKAMGLQAALAGLPLPACEQMVRRLGEDFTSLDEGQIRAHFQKALQAEFAGVSLVEGDLFGGVALGLAYSR